MDKLEHISPLQGRRYPAGPSCKLFFFRFSPETDLIPNLSEHGLATHYIPSARVPFLLEGLDGLEKPTYAQVNETIEHLHYDREPSEPVAPLSGEVRAALDSAFSQATVEGIISALQTYVTGSTAEVVQWAKDTLSMLEERSPTSLEVSLAAIRNGKTLDLLESFKMELGIATAFCVCTRRLTFSYSTQHFPAWRFSRLTYWRDFGDCEKREGSPYLVTSFSQSSRRGQT